MPHAMLSLRETPTANLPPAALPRGVSLGLAAWAAGALVVAATGVVARVPPVAIPLALVSTVAAGVLLYRRGGAVRAWVRGVDVRALVLFHLVRAGFGAAFLVLRARGVLPAAFADLAAPGDIVVGVLAPFAALAAGRAGVAPRRAVLAWNALGLADIVLVVLTAQRLLLVQHDALLRAAFGRFPFGVLPLFVVPAVILSHVAIFARARGPAGSAAALRKL